VRCCLCTTSCQPTTYTLSLHDALPISLSTHLVGDQAVDDLAAGVSELVDGDDDADVALGEAELVADGLVGDREVVAAHVVGGVRSEEHTSELQSRFDLVCRLLLEKKEKWEGATSAGRRVRRSRGMRRHSRQMECGIRRSWVPDGCGTLPDPRAFRWRCDSEWQHPWRARGR